MKVEELYTIKTRFAARKVGDELVVVPLVNNVAHMDKLYTFNESAGFLWENLVEGSTVASLKDKLLEVFDVDEETAEKDVKVFLEKVKKLGD